MELKKTNLFFNDEFGSIEFRHCKGHVDSIYFLSLSLLSLSTIINTEIPG